MKWLCPAIVVLASLAPAVAGAQQAGPTDSDRVTARALAREGHEAQKRGQYAEAEDHFRRADALVHAPTLELGLARAEVGLGKLVEAHETYQRIVRESLPPGAPAPFAHAIDDARRELSALEPRLAWMTIDVRGPASPGLRIDGAPAPAAVLGVRRACNPGEHDVQASAPGFAPAEKTFTVAEGGVAAVSLSMTALPADPPPPEPSPAPPPSAPPVGDSSTPFATKAGIAALGIGAAGLIVGGVTGILVLTKHASLSSDCPDGHCLASDSSEVTRYNTLATISTVAFAVGAAGAVTGVTLLLTSPKRAQVTAYAGFLNAGIAGTF